MKNKIDISKLAKNQQLKCIKTLRMNNDGAQVFICGKSYRVVKFHIPNKNVHLLDERGSIHSISETWLIYFRISDISKILINL